MKILALEFSSPLRGVAVAVDGEVRGEAVEQSGRVTHAFALIDSALQSARVPRNAVECIAIGLGPGSYAGIRIAIAIAQGWQVARGISLLGISSAEVVAVRAVQLGMTRVRVALDAQRDEIYSALYEAAPDRPRLLEPFHLLTDAERGRGEEERNIFRMDLPPGTQTSVGIALPPEAGCLARLAAGRADFVSAGELAPVYLRPVEFVKAAPPKFCRS